MNYCTMHILNACDFVLLRYVKKRYKNLIIIIFMRKLSSINESVKNSHAANLDLNFQAVIITDGPDSQYNYFHCCYQLSVSKFY